jgi:hypothetical protein
MRLYSSHVSGLRRLTNTLPLLSAPLYVACCLTLIIAPLSAQTLLNTQTITGSADDTPAAIATDIKGSVYLAGTTNSPDFLAKIAPHLQFPESALRFSSDGRTFTPSTLSVSQVNTVTPPPTAAWSWRARTTPSIALWMAVFRGL